MMMWQLDRFLSPFIHAAFVSGFGLLTHVLLQPGGSRVLEKKDWLFVAAVFAVTFFLRARKDAFLVAQDTKAKKLAPQLQNIVPVCGEKEPRLVKGRVAVIVFIHTYCKASRTALKQLQKSCKKFGSKVDFFVLTQELKEELEAYATKGINASNYVPLEELGFFVGIEDGTMTKNYQVAHNVETIPHCYVIGKDQMIAWHGHPVGSLEAEVQYALQQEYTEEVKHRSKTDK